MIQLEIDGHIVEVEEGTTILKAAEKLDIKIPTLCYHPLLEPYAACRICTVEVIAEGVSELVTSCNTQVQEGMVVQTQSEKSLNARRINLELLMAQAPAARVVQELAAELGVEKTRLTIEKPEEKCILCGLCVRTCEQVVGVSAISFVNR
ncbi:MAG: (2Fe-2S)-binding protein, partial [Deltaproteobacteria bacterium]|nr:(2Fe-2S)-binding protein [Deltaproteobacteria bacterium]